MGGVGEGGDTDKRTCRWHRRVVWSVVVLGVGLLMRQGEPLWSEADLADPHAVSDKAERVRAMFAAIAPKYDLNNRVHSFGLDRSWRRAAVRAAGVRAGEVVLDVACGTGDLARAFVEGGAGRVVGVDFTFEMLRIAGRKGGAGVGGGRVSPVYGAGDATRLPVGDGSVDVVSIAFGLRNVAAPGVAVREFYRVLRPGGRLVILEFGLPRNALLRGLYNAYFRYVLPRSAALVAGDRNGAYRYLPESVNTFGDRESVCGLMRGAGFERVVATPLTMGVAVVYRGVRGG